MNRKPFEKLKMWLPVLVMLAVLLPLCAQGEAGKPVWLSGNAALSDFDFSGKEELTTLRNAAVERTFGSTWFVNNDLPEEVSSYTGLGGYTLILAKDIADEQTDPSQGIPSKCALEFVSGDELLKNVVSIEEDSVRGMTVYGLCLNYDNMKTTGKAVFRITLESDRYWYQQEAELRVAAYSANPPFSVPDVPVVISAQKGIMFTIGGRQGDLILAAASRIVRSGDAGEVTIDSRAGDGRDYWNSNVFEGLDGISFDQRMLSYTLEKEGTYNIAFPVRYANLQFVLPLRICVTDHPLEGPAMLQPGETGQFRVGKSKGEYTWSLEGKGATVDAGTGLVTAEVDAEPGSLLLVTATPEDGENPVSANLVLGEFGFSAAGIRMEETAGFTYPLLTGSGWKTERGNSTGLWRSSIKDESGLLNQETVYLHDSKVFVHDDASAVDFYEAGSFADGSAESREIRIDGAVAYLFVWEKKNDNGWNTYQGWIRYARDNRLLSLNFTAGRRKGSIDDVPPITLDWLEEMAGMIRYSRPEDTPVLEDAQLTVKTEGDAKPVLNPGQILPLTVAFSNSEKVNAERGNDGVLWTVADAETGEATNVATVSGDGVLTAKKPKELSKVRVTATSEYFRTTASMNVTIYPPVTAITMEPKRLFLYAGSDKSETVRAQLTPDTVPTEGLTWQIKPEGIVALAPGKDGTAMVTPLEAGTAVVTVTEPGGKKGTVNVRVVAAVEDIKLSLTGKAVPGGAVAVRADLLPKTAGNKTVEWSIDVDEEIAGMRDNKIRIAKTAPVGTVITVTCKALGAPEPIVGTIQFRIEEK